MYIYIHIHIYSVLPVHYRALCQCLLWGWRRLIGCLKLQVIFRTRATNYRALLRKMTYEDKASSDFTPPCSSVAYGVLSVYYRALCQCLLYGVATISRLLQNIGLFCKKALSNRLYSAKETYNLKEPTNRSHPIAVLHMAFYHCTIGLFASVCSMGWLQLVGSLKI